MSYNIYILDYICASTKQEDASLTKKGPSIVETSGLSVASKLAESLKSRLSTENIIGYFEVDIYINSG